MKNQINITKTEVPYSQMIKYIGFVINMAFDGNGEYHEYLKDVAETLAVLYMYTDYDLSKIETALNDDNSDPDILVNEILSLRYSKEYEDVIKCVPRVHYTQFMKYLNSEITKVNSPTYRLNKTFNAFTEVLKSINDIVGKIDIDAFADALNKIDTDSINKLFEENNNSNSNKTGNNRFKVIEKTSKSDKSND